MPNPYIIRPVTSPEYFDAARGGRGAQARHMLLNILRRDQPNHLSVLGERRFGKSSLLSFLRQAAQGAPDLFVPRIDMLSLSPPNEAGFYAMLTRALTRDKALAPGEGPLDYDTFDEFLYDLGQEKKRIVLLIDEFDLVAREERGFKPSFFDNLRSLADNRDYPLTLVIASFAPLKAMKDQGIYGSPFFNIFNKELLRLLSEEEAEWLVKTPPGGEAGFGDGDAAEIIRLAGRHPYFLQLACSLAWDLREGGGGNLDVNRLKSEFAEKGRDQFQYIWDHSDDKEQEALFALAHGDDPPAEGLDSLVQRGYALGGASPHLFGEGMADHIKSHCTLKSSKGGGAQREAGAPTVRILPSLRVNKNSPVTRLAVVVGVNEYEHNQAGDYLLSSLSYAEEDAKRLAGLLTDLGFQVKLLTGKQAIRGAIEAEFAAMRKLTADDPHPESCFVFHFSGHGQIDPADRETAYLVLHDTDPRDPAVKGLGMTDLVYRLLPQVLVPHTLVLLDCCHAGFAAGVRNASINTSRLPNITKQVFADARGRMVLAACAGEAKARELAALNHGVFTYYVLRHWRDKEGCNPPNPITYLTLVSYVTDVMPRNHAGLPEPVWSGTGAGVPLILRKLQ